MSRDASGTYTAPSNSWNPAVEGQTIDESDWNTTLQDIEDALTDSLSISGKGKVTSHIDFDETTVTSPASNVGRLYVADVGGVTTLKFKDSAGTDYNLLLSSPGLAYTFSTSTTTNADPGSGYVRFNNATLASVTEIAIDDNDANGANLSAYVLTWDDVGSTDRGTLIIQNRTAPANVVIFTISGASTDETGYTRLAVTYVTHAGSFSANAPLGVTYTKPGATGATGATGSNGAAGANGTDPGIRWLFDSSTTTNADPGSGDLRLNNATLASVTEIAISYSSGETGNPSVETFVKAWDDSTTTGTRGTLILKKASAPQNFAIYTITSAITDGSTYGRFTLSYVAGSGSFSNTDTLAVQFFRTGDKGSDGAGTGDVVGPASSTNNSLARFDGTTGKLLKDGAVIGTDVQAYSAALASWSGVTRASGFDTFTATPSSANLAALLTDETGTGAAVFANSPTLITPALGTPSSITLTNGTGLPVSGITSSTSTALGVGSLELGHASDTTLARSAAGEVTIEGTLIQKAGRQTIWIPAAAMTARTTNGAAAGTAEMTTNKNMFSTLDFDSVTAEYAQFEIHMPKSWNLGTVTFQPVWSHASTSTNFGVVWELAAVARSDDDAGDVAFGTAQTSTDTGGTTNDIYIGPESSAITVAGTPAAGDTVQFQIARAPANGSDTMAIDARLHGIRLFYTSNASTDA